jgi:EAL domain-containing protein (putative c-di-GMP-specific phosphodiesterase class I)
VEIIAEGVETVDQKEILVTMNSQYAQGYHCAKPLPAEAAEKLIVKTCPRRKAI